MMDATAEELIARLRRNPDDMSAYAALRAHYQRAGDHASLVNLLEGWANRASDHGAAAQALYEAGELAAGALEDPVRGASLFERALSRNPFHHEAAQRALEAHEQSGDSAALAEHLERRIEVLTSANVDPRELGALHHRLGEVWEHGKRRADKAVFHYRRAFELDPSLVPAIYAAREIYRSAGNLKAASSLCELEAKAEPDPERKVALYRELAHIRAHDLDDLEAGIVALKRALAIAPGSSEVQGELARMYLLRAERSPDPEATEVDRKRAAELLFQVGQASARAGDDAAAIESLELALDGAPDHDEALGLLEEIAARAGQLDLLPRRWVGFLSRAPEAPGASERRRKLAQAYLEAGQIEYAITCLEWLLEEGDASAASQLVDLYRQVGREADVVRALSVASSDLPPEERVPRLREMANLLRAQGDHDGAAQAARQILELRPDDVEALSVVEERLRALHDWSGLRDLLLAAARVELLEPDDRKQHLREVAALSEQRLSDPDGAIAAYLEISALDPGDREARSALSRLLERAGRWDELVAVLDREALSILDPLAKAEAYRRLATIHRERRGDLQRTILALQNLRDLAPDDRAARDALSEALLEAGSFDDAAPLLRERADEAEGAAKIDLLRRLAFLLEERLGDDEGAFAAFAEVLEAEPDAAVLGEAIAHMVAIDERSENHERLLGTLAYRAELEQGPERAATCIRMARLAADHLGDLRAAAVHYARALDLLPDDLEVFEALCAVYERGQRYRDLVTLLRDRARATAEPLARAELHRRIARTLRHQVENEDAAAEAYRAVLEVGEDHEALTFLREHAEVRGDTAELADYLARLAAISADPSARRDLLLERASLLHDHLGRTEDAIRDLRRIVIEIDPKHVRALEQLAELCEGSGDLGGLADALERRLAVADDESTKISLAGRLADLYEGSLADPERAIAALNVWADSDLTAEEPLRRLIALLERAERWRDLAVALDALAGLAEDSAEASQLVRRAAEVALRKIGDVDGAWERLAVRVREDEDREAEEQLRAIAFEQLIGSDGSPALGARLVELYASLAEQAQSPPIKRARWLDASRLHEEIAARTETLVHTPGAPPPGPALHTPGAPPPGPASRLAALELVLKAFALDLDDPQLLSEVDRLAIAAAAWARLSQVYDTLVRRCDESQREGRARRIELLLRLAEILDEQAEDPSGALDRALRAAAIEPLDDAILARCEDLAPRAGRGEDVLGIYERRKMLASDDAGRVEALLRAVRWSEDTLEDRQRALSFVAQAVALAVRTPALIAAIESTVRELDQERKPARGASLTAALADLYTKIAQRMEGNSRGASMLLLHAAALLTQHLGDRARAWTLLIEATRLAPENGEALDALELAALGSSAGSSANESAPRGAGAALDAHLAKLVDEALDSSVAATLLRRRGAILERFGRHSEAAEVYVRLKTVAPGDPEARSAHLRALRRTDRHQDLLLALDGELARARGDTATTLALRKEIATIWETSLRNKWEAIEAWSAVRKLAPEDPDARAALDRLERGGKKAGPIELDTGDFMAIPEGTSTTEIPRDAAAERTSESPLHAALLERLESEPPLEPAPAPAAGIDDALARAVDGIREPTAKLPAQPSSEEQLVSSSEVFADEGDVMDVGDSEVAPINVSGSDLQNAFAVLETTGELAPSDLEALELIEDDEDEEPAPAPRPPPNRRS